MSIPRHICEFLDSQQIWYQYCTHSPAYTAQGIAHAQHISGKELAKVVMVMAGNELVMAVVPANCRVDLGKLEQAKNAGNVRLATEEEFRNAFPDCELGAMPPFGNLYDVEVWVDDAFRSHSSLMFNAGTHAETIQMSFADFDRLVHPNFARFGVLMH
jgi:Ala-tRNA(Pro) deacylase